MDPAAVLSPALGVAYGVVLTIVAFGLMVFIHELGHFLAAKLMGVRVERFSFGMPPKLFGRKWGETEYVVSALPIGGYVKLAGGDEGQEATGARDEFVSKSPGQRAVILVAGPIFSILFGVPLAIGMLLLGRPTYLAKVSEVTIGSPAWKAGLRHGDRITRLGGRPIITFEDLKQASAQMPVNRPTSMAVERAEQTLTLTLPAVRGQPCGLVFQDGGPRVAQVLPGSLAEGAGLRPGDLIVTLDKRPVRSGADFERRLAQAPSEPPVALLVERGTSSQTLTVLRRRGERLGVSCSFHTLRINKVRSHSPAEAAGLQAGDVIESVDGEPLRGWADFRRRILARADRPTRLGIERDGKGLTVPITPQAQPEGDPGFTIRLPREVGAVRPGFPAEGKLQIGDQIVEVNGHPVNSWTEIEDAVATGPETVALRIERPLRLHLLVLLLATDGLEALRVLEQPNSVHAVELVRLPGPRLADSLGLTPRPVYIIASVGLGTEPPVQVGDEIIRVRRDDMAEEIESGVLYTPFDDVLSYIANAERITVRRDGAEIAVRLPRAKRATGQIGIEPTAVAGMHQETFFGSIVPAVAQTVSIGSFAFVVLWRLLSGDVSIGDLMGPVGIVQQTYLSVERGLSDLFWLIHLITVNIGVFNLIPIPPLDGGRIAMLAYEKVRGRQPSRRLQEAILLAGVALVLMVFVVATFNDILRLIS